MSLAELPFPIFDPIDALLATFLPDAARLVLWGILAGTSAMALYALFSDQAGIRAQKAAMRELQGQLRAAQDDFALTMRLSRANLAASMRLLGKVTLPAVLSSLPPVFLLIWVAETFAVAPPRPGAEVPVTLVPATAEITPRPAPAWSPARDRVTWPAEGELGVADAQGPVWSAPADARRPPVAVHQPVWWNWLYGNTAGYLRPGSAIEEIRFAQQPRDVLGFGPGWLRGWEVVFFASLVIASLSLKRFARID